LAGFLSERALKTDPFPRQPGTPDAGR
jgi:hypothetical protein